MSFNLQVFSLLSSRVYDDVVDAGSLEKPSNVTIDGNTFSHTYTIANAANTVIYSNTIPSGFKALAIYSDHNTRALITDTGSNTFSVRTRGTAVDNEFGMPVLLPDNKTDSTDSNTINTIQIFNTSGNTAHVRIIAYD